MADDEFSQYAQGSAVDDDDEEGEDVVVGSAEMFNHTPKKLMAPQAPEATAAGSKRAAVSQDIGHVSETSADEMGNNNGQRPRRQHRLLPDLFDELVDRVLAQRPASSSKDNTLTERETLTVLYNHIMMRHLGVGQCSKRSRLALLPLPGNHQTLITNNQLLSANVCSELAVLSNVYAAVREREQAVAAHEQELKAKQERERKAKEEHELKAKEKERKEKEQLERKAREAKEKEEKERQARLAKAQAAKAKILQNEVNKDDDSVSF